MNNQASLITKEHSIMKFKVILITLGLFSASAFSAQEITRSEIHQYNKTGNVSISSFRGSFDGALNELRNKVSNKGGEYYRVSSLATSGDSSHWSGTAVIYEKK